MPIYDDRSMDQWLFARSRPKRAEELAPLEELGVFPRRVPFPTPVAAESPTPQPRATWNPEGEFVLRPYGSPLQRKARREREWLHSGAILDTHLTHPLAHLIDQQGATNPYQQAIDQHGAHDPYLNSSETAEVNIKWSGAYDLSKDKDPRLNLSQPHLATAPQKYYWAAVDVYYDRIAYTTLLEAIEAIAKRHDQYPAFRKAALEFIGSTDRLPLSKDALLLAQQIQIKDFEESIFFYIKSRFAKMKEEGVKIERDQKDKIRGDLLRIWASWHPDKEVAR